MKEMALHISAETALDISQSQSAIFEFDSSLLVNNVPEPESNAIFQSSGMFSPSFIDTLIPGTNADMSQESSYAILSQVDPSSLFESDRSDRSIGIVEEDYLKIFQNNFDEKESEVGGNIDENDTDISDDEVLRRDCSYMASQQDYESDSELEVNLDHQKDSGHKDFYLGKDKTTKWMKACTNVPRKTEPNDAKIFPGPAAKGIDDEISAFLKIIDVEMIDHIVTQTNLCIQAGRTDVKYRRERDMKYTSRSEIMAILGILYLLGIKQLHQIKGQKLWTSDGTGIEILRACMSYKRFLFVLRSIRFEDGKNVEIRSHQDKLAVIRVILESFINNCKSSYNLSEYVVVDEILERYRGRCSFIQHVPNMSRYCIKISALYDAKSFYISNIEVYCGTQKDGPYSQSNSPSDIVKRLVSHIEGTNRNVTTDTWCTSYSLSQYLLGKNLTNIGSLPKNSAELPAEFLPNKAREVASSVFGFQKNCTLVSYVPKKKKAVILLSTMHNIGTIDKNNYKPNVLLDYYESRGGMDTIDRMCTLYSVARDVKRWSMTLFFVLMNIAGINARVLYCESKNIVKLSRTEFLKHLSLNLMKPYLQERARIYTLPSDVSLFLEKYRKRPVEQDEQEEPNKRKNGRCHICKRNKNIKTTTTIRCCRCSNFSCKQHMISICKTCKNSAGIS